MNEPAPATADELEIAGMQQPQRPGRGLEPALGSQDRQPPERQTACQQRMAAVAEQGDIRLLDRLPGGAAGCLVAVHNPAPAGTRGCPAQVPARGIGTGGDNILEGVLAQPFRERAGQRQLVRAELIGYQAERHRSLISS